MKAIVKKLLFKALPAKAFQGIELMPGEIKEKVYLEYGNPPQRLDVTNTHWLLCLEPLIIGVWAAAASWVPKEPLHLHFYRAGNADSFKTDLDRPVTTMVLQYVDAIKIAEAEIVLFRVESTALYHLNRLNRARLFLYQYLSTDRNMFRLTWTKFKQLAAAYSFPRKVVLVAVQNEAYYSIFPMDLQGCLGDVYLLGLRHTNTGLTKIIEGKKLVVCETPSATQETIYQLGKYHSAKPPAKESMPFQTFPSQHFQFPLPTFILAYREIVLLDTYNLGSQMLLVGKVFHEERREQNEKQLYHIHSLYALALEKK